MLAEEVSHSASGGGGVYCHFTNSASGGGRHTDNSRSSAPDIAVPRQALCYLSRSNRGLKNRRLSLLFTTSAFLSPSKSRKSQATKCRAFKTNSALNKHRISKNQ